MSVLYVGAYAWSFSTRGDSSSASEATTVSGVHVSVSNAGCSNCSAVTTSDVDSNGANAYGGSMSVLYVGAYAWAASYESNSSSASAGSIVYGISVSVRNVGCSICSAVTFSSQESSGANAYGGSMSVLYVGAYAWSVSEESDSFSASEATTVSGVDVRVSNASCSNCSAVTTSKSSLSGANAYGGSMSVLYVGAYAGTYSTGSKSSSSSSASTNVSGVSMVVSDAPCFDCTAVSLRRHGQSGGANTYGGSMSVLYVGAYAWSFSKKANSSSASEATTVSGVHVSVSNASCSICSAVTTSEGFSHAANAYGGSMSVLYVGAYAWSYSTRGDSSSASEATTVSGVHVSVSNAGCSNCSAVTSSGGISNGANAYGGSMSVLVFGAHAFSFCLGQFTRRSLSHCGPTKAFGLNVSISSCAFSGAQAMTRAFWHRYTFHHHQAHSDMFQERLAVLEMPTFVSISLTAHCKDIAAITLARLSASC
jgi:hypothetical protein